MNNEVEQGKREALQAIIDSFAQAAAGCHNPDKPGASRVPRHQLLELLLRVQDSLGYVPSWSIEHLATACNTTRADVYGVAGFYDDIRLVDDQPAKPKIQICRAEACQSMGADRLFSQAEERLQQQAEVESVYCLGNCALAPSARIGDRIIARAEVQSLAALAEQKQSTDSADCLIAPTTPVSQQGCLYLGLDTGSISVGSAELLQSLTQLATEQQFDLVTTGGRGLYHLEPLVEIAQEGVRHAFVLVSAQDVPELLKSGKVNTSHACYAGEVAKLPELACQNRLTFARAGEINPLDFAGWQATGGMAGMNNAFKLDPAQLVELITASGLRGRGGAGFPTGIKWRTVMQAEDEQKYVVCNADEGDSGTFADRLLMESDPFTLIEGMVIAAYAVGANQGYIYLRSEYPLVHSRISAALQQARTHGLLGKGIAGKLDFDIELRRGAGAYICGEETSLLESLEGKRGTIRFKPPLPAIEGAFSKPTALNNVITLATVPYICANGAEAHAALGRDKSRGTLTLQLAGNIKRGGLYEVPFGMSLRELIEDIGGGSASGRPIRAVQVGGPLGAYFPPELFDLPLDYEAFAAQRGMLGHGGVVVFDDSVNLAAQAEYAMLFCAHESCGKCTPCRLGSTRGAELISQMRVQVAAGSGASNEQVALLSDLCELMEQTSLCALGGMTPYPVTSALKHFPQDFGLEQETVQLGAVK